MRFPKHPRLEINRYYGTLRADLLGNRDREPPRTTANIEHGHAGL
jgi:hypothetical protein